MGISGRTGSFVAKVVPLPNNYQGGAYKLPEGYNNSSTASMVRKYNNQSGNDSELLQSIDQPENVSISIYPNPNRGYLSLSVDLSTLPVCFDITNANGVEVNKSQITSNQQIIDISALSKGVYIIRFYLKEETITKKIILI